MINRLRALPVAGKVTAVVVAGLLAAAPAAALIAETGFGPGPTADSGVDASGSGAASQIVGAGAAGGFGAGVAAFDDGAEVIEVVLDWPVAGGSADVSVEVDLFRDPVIVPGYSQTVTVALTNAGPTNGWVQAYLDALAWGEQWDRADVVFDYVRVNDVSLAELFAAAGDELETLERVALGEPVFVPVGATDAVDFEFTLSFDREISTNAGNTPEALGEALGLLAVFSAELVLSGLPGQHPDGATLVIDTVWNVQAVLPDGSVVDYPLTASEAAALGLVNNYTQHLVSESLARDSGTELGDVVALAHEIEAPQLCEVVSETRIVSLNGVARDFVYDVDGTQVFYLPRGGDEQSLEFQLRAEGRNVLGVAVDLVCRTQLSIVKSAAGPFPGSANVLDTYIPDGAFDQLDEWGMQLWSVTDGVPVRYEAWEEHLVVSNPGGSVRALTDGLWDPNHTLLGFVPVDPSGSYAAEVFEMTPEFRLWDNRSEVPAGLADLDKGSLNCWLADLAAQPLTGDLGDPDGTEGVVQPWLGHHTICEKVSQTARLSVASFVDIVDEHGVVRETRRVGTEIRVTPVDADGNPIIGGPTVQLVADADGQGKYFRVRPGHYYLVEQVLPQSLAGAQFGDALFTQHGRYATRTIRTLDAMQNSLTQDRPFEPLLRVLGINTTGTGGSHQVLNSTIVTVEALQTGTLQLNATLNQQPGGPGDDGQGPTGPQGPQGPTGQPGTSGRLPVTGASLAVLILAATALTTGALTLATNRRRNQTT